MIFDLTRPRIEPESTALVADALSIGPLLYLSCCWPTVVNDLQHNAFSFCFFSFAVKLGLPYLQKQNSGQYMGTFRETKYNYALPHFFTSKLDL